MHLYKGLRPCVRRSVRASVRQLSNAIMTSKSYGLCFVAFFFCRFFGLNAHVVITSAELRLVQRINFLDVVK